VGSGVRQRLIFLVFTGLLVTMGVIGTYRYVKEKRDMLATSLSWGEQSGKLMAGIAAPYLQASDLSSLHSMAETFMQTSDAQDMTVIDSGGRKLIHVSRPVLAKDRIAVAPQPILSGTTKLGEIRIAVYPADLKSRLGAYALGLLLEYIFIFIILAAILFISVTRTITLPVKKFGNTLKEAIDRKDFTLRVEAQDRNEIGALANGVNYLIARLEQFIVDTGAIASRISELSPTIVSDTREVKKNSEVEAGTIQLVSSSVVEISSSIQSIAESAEGLSSSAEETSSAILEMNASNQEVARNTDELTTSVDEVTSSVSEMIASIREVAGHVETLSSAAEETSASALQIEATVREVEQAAKESTGFSQQVSREAQDIGVKSIRETMSAIDTIKLTITKYSDTVMRLGKRSEEIGNILGVIVDVTERTNLLALNASILAAQAGEHGKGFAVVAEEIKALAERTAGSAQDIGKLITSVQREAKEAVTAMSGSLSAVEEGVRRSKEAGAALDKILASSNRSAEMVTMIERAMTEQARGIKQVSEAIMNVKQMMMQIAGASHAQTVGTEKILGAAEGMRNIAHQVRASMTEQGRGGKQIAMAADNVTKRAGAIATGTREQRWVIGQIQESMERIQDFPRKNIKRVDDMAGVLKTLGEQAGLLNQEISTMKVRRGHRDSTSGTLKMGVIPLEAPGEMFRRFTPLSEYLSQVIGRRVELSVAVDFIQTLKDLEEGITDLAYLTPTTYIEAHEKFGAKLLVKALRNGSPYTRSAIVAKTGGGIVRLEDVRGKRFAFGDRMSTSSYLVPRAMLAEAGIGLEGLKESVFLGHHDDVAKAVIAGEYDAGGLREPTARAFQDQGLELIKTSIDIPEFNVSASKHVDQATADLIEKALIALDQKDKSHARVLAAIDASYTGFSAAADSDYDGIRKIMEKMGTTASSA
jgi:phosphate/phosphite/phosphonate ABC transporter binding protein